MTPAAMPKLHRLGAELQAIAGKQRRRHEQEGAAE